MDLSLDRKRTRELFQEFAMTRSPEVRERLVLAHASMVRYVAQRFAFRGESLEDLIQVGMLGLLKAIDRFDPKRGFEFMTFAFPTIIGELKRHFRDRAWAMHVPRRLQDLNLAVTRAAERLSVELGRSPTVDDIAQRLAVTAESVLEAQELGRAYSPLSLDAKLTTSDRGDQPALLAERIGCLDPNVSLVEDIATLKGAFEALDRKERLVLYLRFYEDVPQSEIACRLSVSQMNISRLQRSAVAKLRHAFFDGAIASAS